MFCNPELVENIKHANETLAFAANGGDFYTNQEATVVGYGDVWFDPKAITNIFSLSGLEKLFKVIYDSTMENAFKIHLTNKEIQFAKSHNGLYYFKPTYNTMKKNIISKSFK